MPAITADQIRADLADIITEVVGTPATSIDLDKTFFDDLGVDSLSMVEVLYACEDKFGVTIPEEASKKLRTVGDAVTFIEQHL